MHGAGIWIPGSTESLQTRSQDFDCGCYFLALRCRDRCLLVLARQMVCRVVRPRSLGGSGLGRCCRLCLVVLGCRWFLRLGLRFHCWRDCDCDCVEVSVYLDQDARR